MMFFNSSHVEKTCSYAVSNVGRVRRNNEDNLVIRGTYISEEAVSECANGSSVRIDGGDRPASEPQLFAVCDGMGGEALGEVASLAAAKVFAALNDKLTANDIDNALAAANAAVLKECDEHCCFRMGTTLALVYIENGIMHAVNVGDSRIYFMRGSKLRQISYDHTELQYYIDAKLITKEEARNNPARHGLTQHIGMTDPMKPYRAKKLRLEPGDRVLLCSDGVTDMLEDEDIAAVLAASATPNRTADDIVNAALENGGADNATAIVIFAQ